EAALMQIGHYHDSVNLFPEPSPEASEFRDGELFYYEIFCLVKTGEQDKAREVLQRGLKLCPESWHDRALKILGDLDD
ncbi:MAG: hypothetical protein JXA52_01880, partial [Planctomycetes bacterium]|nr:hypothetical protein [Planctomycetota bacterium]